MNATDSPINENRPDKVGILFYVLAGFSFIPCLGVPIGLIVICLGIVKKSRLLALLGFLGISFTVAIYGTLYYFSFYQRGGVYDHLRSQMAVAQLNETVKQIEYYKLQNGHYPSKLTDLLSKNTFELPAIDDPTAMERNNPSDIYFYYQLDSSGSFYYLRSVGPDGKPFTSDDILPNLPESERKKTGLRLDSN